MRIGLIVAVLTIGKMQAGQLELKPETLQAWDQYVHQATLAMQQRLHGNGPFLRLDENADRMAAARAGEIVVWQADQTNPRHVPSGLIHDWIGAAFIPNSRIEDVLSVVRNYSRYKDMYKPGVLDAKLLRQTGAEDQFSILLRNNTFFTRTALDSEYDSSYTRLDEHRWYSVSCSTRVQEIEDFGGPGQHKLPPDEGHGYIWRLNSLSQLEERDGGVYVEEELIALSRDLPAVVRQLAGPIIRRVARESLAASIDKTRLAVKDAVKDNQATIAAKSQGGSYASGGCRRAGAVGCLR
jgi:hypothetical protein